MSEGELWLCSTYCFAGTVSLLLHMDVTTAVLDYHLFGRNSHQGSELSSGFYWKYTTLKYPLSSIRDAYPQWVTTYSRWSTWWTLWLLKVMDLRPRSPNSCSLGTNKAASNHSQNSVHNHQVIHKPTKIFVIKLENKVDIFVCCFTHTKLQKHTIVVLHKVLSWN